MSRYRGPKLRISRRFGKNVVLPGLTTKLSKKTQPPGKPKPKDDSDNKNQKPTEYGIRLNEKQKLKFNYGLTENQLFRYVKEARRRHELSLLGTVMLGRALTGVMLLASDLKGEERVLLRLEGDGSLGIITAEANRAGEIRGFVQNPKADIDVEKGERLEDGVGKGLLSVSKILFSEAQAFACRWRRPWEPQVLLLPHLS